MNQYTREVLEKGLSRRGFLARMAAGAAGAGLAGAGALAAETPAAGNTRNEGGFLPAFLTRPASVEEKEIAETVTYDVVVVGAGASGVPAALAAREQGARVAVVQKAPFALSQGNTGSGLDLAKCDRAGIAALVSRIVADNDHRANRKLVEQWAYNSGEAVQWVIDRARKGGSPVISQGNLQHMDSLRINGYNLSYFTAFFGPKPYTAGDGMRHLAVTATAAGVDFFYNMPAVELVQSDAGAVGGVIARGRDGRCKRFLAAKGVILATGDYQNHPAMSDYFLPDASHFGRKQMGKTGDGHLLTYWAGGVIEPIGHTKMVHDFDGGPATMCEMPFLSVNRLGERFVNETLDMSLYNNYLRDEVNRGCYAQIFDADYMTQAAGWPGKLVPPEGLVNWMPEEPGEKKGVLEPFIATFKADTLEQLAAKLGVPAAAFTATVRRYNELAQAGRDEDFGKPAELLKPIVRAPFYGIHRGLRLSAICSGVLIDERHRTLDAKGNALPGLYAIGNLGGGFYGGVDYPLTVLGLSLGRCYTDGYMVGRAVAKS